MKKRMRMLLCWTAVLALLCALAPGAALAKDTMTAFARYAAALVDAEGEFAEPPPDLTGKVIIAVYDKLTEEPIGLSIGAASAGRDFYGIPAAYLAEEIDDAALALIVYPTRNSKGKPVAGLIFAVDVANDEYYMPYELDVYPTYVYLPEEGNFPLRPSLGRIAEALLGPFAEESASEREKRVSAGPTPKPTDPPDEAYLTALEYYNEGKYYTAMTWFNRSNEPDAADRAEDCIQYWPRTGEFWRSNSIGRGNLDLTIKVNQSDEVAMFFRIYRGDDHVCSLFIGGNRSATVTLPSGYYRIQTASGEDWFGEVECFGRGGSYANMLFNGTDREFYLRSGGDYVLTVNTQDKDPNADDVINENISFDSFTGGSD